MTLDISFLLQVISDAYFSHSVAYDNPSLTFVSFDFHEFCRGMHFENIAILVDALEERMRVRGQLHYDD